MKGAAAVLLNIRIQLSEIFQYRGGIGAADSLLGAVDKIFDRYLPG